MTIHIWGSSPPTANINRMNTPVKTSSIDPQPTSASRVRKFARKRGPVRNAIQHFVEMVIAMVAGMSVLEPLWTLIGGLSGTTAVLARPDVGAIVMATNMTIGMSIWMLYRRHGWRAITEMGAAMYVPFAVLLIPYWTSLISAETLEWGGHLLMLPAMAGAMLLRPTEYTRDHTDHGQHTDGGCHTDGTDTGRVAVAPGRRLITAVVRRWPAWLALGMTVENWTNPGVPAAWILLLWPVAYLVAGAIRQDLGNRRAVITQVIAFVGYLIMFAVTMVVDPELARYVIAAGWFAHAALDLSLFRSRSLIPRPFAEWCAVFDTVIGITILLA